MKNVKIFALIVIVITISVSIGWMLINNNITNKKTDILEVEREKFIGRWTSSDRDEEYYFFPDGTLRVNETTYHFGMGVSSIGYKIYNGTWEIVEVSDTNGSSHFEFYTNYSCVEWKNWNFGSIFGSSIVPNQFPYEFKELNSTIYLSFILPGLFGSNYTVKLEKVEKTIKIQVLVVSNYLADPSNLTWKWSNESYVIDVHEGEYFGISNSSKLVSKYSDLRIWNITNGSRLFKLIQIINSNLVMVWWNESALFNISLSEENPILISTNEQVFKPKYGNLLIDPRPSVSIWIKIID